MFKCYMRLWPGMNGLVIFLKTFHCWDTKLINLRDVCKSFVVANISPRKPVLVICLYNNTGLDQAQQRKSACVQEICQKKVLANNMSKFRCNEISRFLLDLIQTIIKIRSTDPFYKRKSIEVLKPRLGGFIRIRQIKSKYSKY